MMKEEPRTKVTHLRNRNFKHKMERQQIPAKTFVRKVLGTRTNFTCKKLPRKFIKKFTSCKKTCKPNNRDLNRD